jgi:alpha-L-fucosidase
MIVEPGIKDELRWFYEARFGMFVHFGLYSLLGRGEWVQYHEGIPRAEYGKLCGKFNPSRFCAEEWVGLAEEAGAKYIAVTAKHHDGFCLFDSVLTDFKITNTPFKRDLIGELAQACQRRGMRIVFYYSQPDWHHPNYLHHPGAFKDLPHPPANDRPDWPAYVKYYMGQVEELCTKYGRIDGIWFDGSHKTVEEWRGREIYALIKQHQPHAVVNDRGRCGDFFTPERSLPEDLTDFMFEACESISPSSWGYQGDTASYSAPYLLDSLIRMACAGGNYLLNVGPTPDGRIPENQARVMRVIGQWLKINGNAIYHTDPVRLSPPRKKSPKVRFLDEEGVVVRKRMLEEFDYRPLPAEDFGFTRTGDRLYLHCRKWPEIDQFTVPGIKSAPTKAKLLASGEEIAFRVDGDGLELSGLPPAPPGALPQVIEFTFSKPPRLDVTANPVKETVLCRISESGATELPAGKAEFTGYGVKGTKLRLVVEGEREMIDGWWVPEQEAHWRVYCPRAGAYTLSVLGGCAKNDTGAVIRIAGAGSQELKVDMPPLSDDGGFNLAEAGIIELAVGESVIAVNPAKLKWGYIFGRIEKLILEPVTQ